MGQTELTDQISNAQPKRSIPQSNRLTPVQHRPENHAAMINDEFSQLLQSHMRRIRASAAGVATEIGMSREAVNNWRNGHSMPSHRHRDKVMACARYLRLTEAESNALLIAAGFSIEYLLAEDLPSQLCAEYIDGLFQRIAALVPYPIMMLLSQAGWGEPPFRDAVFRRARQSYGEDSTLHVHPPFSLGADASEYFRQVGEQCGLEGITDDYAFERALEQRLKSGERLFMMVSRFDQGVAELRETLAGIVRSLSEMYPGQLFLMLCGGERLAELKYQNGDLSLLNIATVEYWPQLSTTEIQLLARHREAGLMLNDAQARDLLECSGGHPGLISLGLSLMSSHDGHAIDDLAQQFADSDLLWQSFSRVAVQALPQLGELLTADDLGPARPYLTDKLLKTLFWQNLIHAVATPSGNRLQWRSEAIVQAGRQFLSQHQQDS